MIYCFSKSTQNMVLVKEKEVEAALVKRASFCAFVLHKWYSVFY